MTESNVDSRQIHLVAMRRALGAARAELSKAEQAAVLAGGANDGECVDVDAIRSIREVVDRLLDAQY